MQFPSETPWSVIIEAANANAERRQEALDCLYRLYAPPVFVYLISRTRDRHQAEDLTQDLFLNLIKRTSLLGLRERKGQRFRAYLKKAAENLFKDAGRRADSKIRGGEFSFVSLPDWFDDTCVSQAATNTKSPDALYDQNWARSLVENVLSEMRTDYAAHGEEQTFMLLLPLMTEGGDKAVFEQTANCLGKTAGAVKTAASRMKKEFRVRFRKAVAQTLGSPIELDDEIHYLQRILGE
jgi:RNA polymerase sigma-70 factor, ECF subfamily